MTVAIDPVGSRIIASLAHPGGSVTGLATSSDDTVPKQLQLLAKMAGSKLSRLGLLFNPNNVGSPNVLKTARDSAAMAGMQLVSAYLENAQDVDSALATLTKGSVEAFMVGSDPIALFHVRRIAEFAIANRLLTIFPNANTSRPVERRADHLRVSFRPGQGRR
jgi:ABC-type uncharacterized transport system substrate-binding protein